MPDPEMPEFLRRWPPDPDRERAASAAWDARWADLREQNFLLERGDDEVVTLMTLHLEDPTPIPRLAPGDHRVKVLAVSEKWARIDLGPQVGPVMLKRETWDSIQKEKIMDVIQTPAANEAEAPAPKPKKVPAAKKAAPAPEKKAAKKMAPAAPAAKGKKAAPAAEGKKSPEEKQTKKAVLMALFRKNVGKPISAAAACKAIYGTAEGKEAALTGVIIGCTIIIEGEGGRLVKEGKGADATYTYRKK